MPDILDADEIDRVDVPASEQTDDRDDAAEYISDMWPATLTEIAEESGYSRQHIRNTLDTYFKPADIPGGMATSQDSEEVPELNLPGHERELLMAYRMGYRDGRQDAHQNQG